MEYINLNQYINKQTGDILEAIDWNNLHTTLQSKINEIVDSYNQLGTKIELVNLAQNLLKTEITPGIVRVGDMEHYATIGKDLITVSDAWISSSEPANSSIAKDGITVFQPAIGLGAKSHKMSITANDIEIYESTDPVLILNASGISKETEGGTLKIDSKHNALWLHGGSDSSVLDGQDVTIGAGNKITLDANNGVEITSSKIDLLSDNIGVNGDEGRTCDVTVSTPNGTCMFSFKNGILIGYYPTIEERPVDLEDIDENP